MESASGRHSGESENPTLTTPLSYTGTPEELDAELGHELAGYIEPEFRRRTLDVARQGGLREAPRSRSSPMVVTIG